MGGRPGLCSAIQSSPWQAVCRGCVRVCVCVRCAIVACTEIIPAFVASPPPSIIHPPPQRRNVNTFFCTFSCSFSAPLVCFHGDRIWRTRAVTYPQRQLFTIKHQAFRTPHRPAETAYFHCRLPALCRSFCAAVQWNKKGDCLYLGTMEQLSAAAELTRSDSPAPRKIIVLDHKPLYTDQWNCV